MQVPAVKSLASSPTHSRHEDDDDHASSQQQSHEKHPPVNWEQGKLIGQGAFGRVFLALDLDSGTIMAVKQVILGTEDSPQKRKQENSLRQEIELFKDLDHENIVQYLGFEITDKAFNVFLEYVSGGSIAGCLAKCGHFDDIITQNFCAQILCGLEYLHLKSIIHRDIKGANVLINDHGIAKISDFGISKKNEYMAYQRMTRMSMQGSIYWMAPEVARGKGYSAKVDVWSVGCLVLEMATGHHPWYKARGNIVYLLGMGNRPPIPDTVSDLIKSFLEDALKVDPELRPTASELLNCHTFTDIDPTLIDFNSWFRNAMEARQRNGSSGHSVTAANARRAADQQDNSNSDSDSDESLESDDDDELEGDLSQSP